MINLPAEWVDADHPLETRAFYELMQMYRHASFEDAAAAFEQVKEYLRTSHNTAPVQD
jgi:hypothetical protein